MTREEARASIKKHLDLMYPYNTPKDVLKVAYEAVEQPQIVRCKDCKSNSGCGAGIYSGMVICYNTRAIHSPDWYCADGKQKEGG